MINASSKNTLEILASRGDASIDRKHHPPTHLRGVDIPRSSTTRRNRERFHTTVEAFLVGAVSSALPNAMRLSRGDQASLKDERFDISLKPWVRQSGSSTKTQSL